MNVVHQSILRPVMNRVAKLNHVVSVFGTPRMHSIFAMIGTKERSALAEAANHHHFPMIVVDFVSPIQMRNAPH